MRTFYTSSLVPCGIITLWAVVPPTYHPPYPGRDRDRGERRYCIKHPAYRSAGIGVRRDLSMEWKAGPRHYGLLQFNVDPPIVGNAEHAHVSTRAHVWPCWLVPPSERPTNASQASRAWRRAPKGPLRRLGSSPQVSHMRLAAAAIV